MRFLVSLPISTPNAAHVAHQEADDHMYHLSHDAHMPMDVHIWLPEHETRPQPRSLTHLSLLTSRQA